MNNDDHDDHNDSDNDDDGIDDSRCGEWHIGGRRTTRAVKRGEKRERELNYGEEGLRKRKDGSAAGVRKKTKRKERKCRRNKIIIRCVMKIGGNAKDKKRKIYIVEEIRQGQC